MDKFIFFQYYNLSDQEFKNLNNLIEEFYKSTGIIAVAVPKEIELLTKEDLIDLTNRLKEK